MWRFCIYIFKLLALIFVIAFVLDYCYTQVYFQSKVRNKIEKVINSENEVYDLVILGSSRANNHFVASKFEEIGLRTYNYGISGSRLQETALLLEIMLANNFKIKNIILEIDLNINSEGHSEGTRAKFMPYINGSEIISNYYEDKIKNVELLKYIPFYRYIKYDAQIGFREMFFSSIGKTSPNLNNYGFKPLYGTSNVLKYNMSNLEPKKNGDYERIKELCKLNKIRLIAVTTPICENVINYEYFVKIKKIYPEVYDYEKVVNDDKFFSTCGHMNVDGASLFTDKIIQDFF